MVLITERKFKAYYNLQMLGKCNMFDIKCVSFYIQLNRKELLDIMENYQKYYERWIRV